MKNKKYISITFGPPAYMRCTGCSRAIFPEMGAWCTTCRGIYKPDEGVLKEQEEHDARK